MPRTCCVVGCLTGYKSNKEKVSTFSFSKNEEILNKWIKVVPRRDFTVTKNSAIRSKHFTDDQIITGWTSGVGEQKVVVSTYPILCYLPNLKTDSKGFIIN